jgi:hypothetical protein
MNWMNWFIGLGFFILWSVTLYLMGLLQGEENMEQRLRKRNNKSTKGV